MVTTGTEEDRPRTSGEYAYRALREAIVNGHLPAGSRLQQSAWATELGVSLTPVREAIRRLQAEGLVEVAAHRGTSVIGLNLEDCRDIYRMRMLIDPLLVEPGMARFTDERRAEALALCERMEATADAEVWSEHNRRFHDLLADGASPWMAKVAEILRGASAPYVALSLRSQPDQLATTNADHRDLLAAYAERNLEAAQTLVERHLQSTVDIVDKVLGQTPAADTDA